MPDAKEPPMNAVAVIIRAYSDDERKVLLHWAHQVVAIRESGLPYSKKVIGIVKLTKELGLVKPLVLHLLSELRRIGWDERSKAMRGVIGGSIVGMGASVAGPMAGVAAFGGAMAVPVLLLGAGGGAIVGAIIQEATRGK